MKQIGNVEVPQKSLPRRTEAGLKILPQAIFFRDLF